MIEKLYKLDGVLWSDDVTPEPLCPKHRLEMDAYSMEPADKYDPDYDHLRCEECEKDYVIPRDIHAQQTYIRRKLNSFDLKGIKVLNLDDEAIPIVEDKISSVDKKYFVKALLTKSKVGQRLVIYAGEKGKIGKTQIFVEPEIRRLAFDQNDLHPTDVFLKVEAEFADGTKSSFRKKK